jgi:hypothetical protein
MGARRLPVAPRPFRDETLSSWLGRVACRYGLDAPALAACLAFPDNPSNAPRPPIDDISANSGQIALWARACAVDPARLRRMTLAARNPRRPRAWFLNRDLVATRMVISPPPSPVCPACFDDDWVAGHDGYLRASWLLAERCVCPAHGRMLIDQCPSCHAHVHVAFRLRENRARAVCARCEGALELGAGEGDRYSGGMSPVLVTMQARIAAAVDHAPIYRGRLEEVVAALWSALDDPGASRPVLTLWGSERGWRLPAEAGQAVGRPMPLGLLRVPFRALTLVALRDLFGEDIAALAGPPPERAARLLGRAAFLRPAPTKSPRAPPLLSGRKGRSPADYLAMAREILAHPDWVAAAELPERSRRRVLGRLADRALGPGFSASGDLAAGAASSRVQTAA